MGFDSLFSFFPSLFSPISCLVPLFPPPRGLSSPAYPVYSETRQGLCSAIPAYRLLQDTAEEKGSEVKELNAPEEMAGGAALLPPSLALARYT